VLEVRAAFCENPVLDLPWILKAKATEIDIHHTKDTLRELLYLSP
jgi:hypothetical protein